MWLLRDTNAGPEGRKLNPWMRCKEYTWDLCPAAAQIGHVSGRERQKREGYI
jgi:hypothetical protein